MQDSQPNSVTVNILDKEYRVACPDGEEQSLIESARQLDGKMRDIRNSGKVIGMERIAVMAALNISHELLFLESEHQQLKETTKLRLSKITKKVDQAISSRKKPGKKKA